MSAGERRDPLAAKPPRPDRPDPPPTAPEPPTQEWRWQRTLPPREPDYADQDPLSPAYGRTDIDETASSVLWFWFGRTPDDPAALDDRQRLWFQKSFETDAMIAHRFSDLLARLASGEALRWAEKGPRERLAAIVALDQFSRNIFRNEAAAFENDALASQLTREALKLGEDRKLAPIERWFLLMPLEHSESATDQRRSVDKFAELAGEAPEPFKPALDGALDFAKKHAAVIRRFGRFPHRNAALGRASTSAEKAFLKKPGSRF